MMNKISSETIFKKKKSKINKKYIFCKINFSVGQDVQISTVLTWKNIQKLYILPNIKLTYYLSKSQIIVQNL